MLNWWLGDKGKQKIYKNMVRYQYLLFQMCNVVQCFDCFNLLMFYVVYLCRVWIIGFMCEILRGLFYKSREKYSD